LRRVTNGTLLLPRTISDRRLRALTGADFTASPSRADYPNLRKSGCACGIGIASTYFLVRPALVRGWARDRLLARVNRLTSAEAQLARHAACGAARCRPARARVTCSASETR